MGHLDGCVYPMQSQPCHSGNWFRIEFLEDQKQLGSEVGSQRLCQVRANNERLWTIWVVLSRCRIPTPNGIGAVSCASKPNTTQPRANPKPNSGTHWPPCQADEMYSTMDDQYEMCKPMCSSSCPSFSGSAEPVCEYGTCSLVCSGDDECPSGAVCLGTHRCWYPGTFTVV